jgi:hypothetical protein
MHIDIDVEISGDGEDPVDLAVRVRIGLGCGADHRPAALEGLQHQFVGAGVVEQTLLGEDADFKVDGPLILLNQRMNPFKAAKPDTWIDLKLSAHVCRAIEDGALQRDFGALIDVFRREQLLLFGDLGNGLFEVTPFRAASPEDARLIEVDVGLDEAWRDQPSGEIQLFAFRRKVWCDGGDASFVNADICCDAFIPDYAGGT